MGSYRAKNVSISELLKAHARGVLPGLLKVDQGNREAILRALNNWGWDDSLKLYLPFNETAGQTAFDLSGNGNTGTVSGTTIVDGVFGKARSFDGVDDYVNCGVGASLDIVDAITIEGWIYLRERKSWNYVGGKDHAYMLAESDSELRPHISVDGGWRFCPTGVQTPLNTWTYWAVTYSKVTRIITAYWNGEKAGETTLSGLAAYEIDSNTNPVIVGHYQIAPANNVNGLIDEPRIYSRALTADEIYLHYLAGALKLGLI